MVTITKTYNYKGKVIAYGENGFCYIIFIVGENKTFGSVADAKKYINGKPTTWAVQEMYEEQRQECRAAEKALWQQSRLTLWGWAKKVQPFNVF